MSRGKPDRKPLIALVHNADKAFQAHMVRSAHERGRPDLKPAHNFLFAILGDDGDRAANLAARAGITRQSMGEVIRDLVDIGILEMAPDPQDGRSALISANGAGRERLRRLRGRKNAYLARRMRDMPAADIEALERAAEILEQMLEDERG